MTDLHYYLPKYTAYLEHNRGLSLRTCIEYVKDLNDFCSWANNYTAMLPIRECTSVVILTYEEQLSKRDLSAACIKRRISAIRSFFRYLQASGLIEDNPAQFLPTPRLHQQLVKPAPYEAVMAFLRQTPTSFRQQRLRTLVAILLATGIRISEALALNRCDFNFETHSVRILGKGSKERIVYFSDSFEDILDSYMLLCPSLMFRGYSHIAARYDIAHAIKDGDRGISPHQIRHLYAVRCLEAGMPLKTLSILLGHTSIKTTERYLQLADPNLQQAVERYAPTFD